MNLPQSHRATERADINRITERIIGCAIEVHRILGCGLFESVYRASLAIEFDLAGVKYSREVRLPAVYKGELVGEYAIDCIVEDRVVVEVKSVERMNPAFARRYSRISRSPATAWVY